MPTVWSATTTGPRWPACSTTSPWAAPTPPWSSPSGTESTVADLMPARYTTVSLTAADLVDAQK